MIRYLGREAVLRLNETHGYFQFRDAQGDVSRDFANDAVSAFIAAGVESSRVLDETGKTPAELAASLADAQAEIARLRGALEKIAQLQARVAELESLVSADVAQAYRLGYDRRHAEVLGALV